MCTVNLDHCDCDCHRMDGVVHMWPCCYTCQVCGANILKWLWGAHVMSHRPTEEDNNADD